MTPAPTPANPNDDTRLRQKAIGEKLRQIFDEVVQEPVPESFLNILRQADTQSNASD